jgi:hypothetical protein
MRGFILSAALALPSCIAVTNAATPTALERQLLGEYEELDRELATVASVRTPQVLPSDLEGLKALAVDARGLQRFNQDDLAELKSAGCIAERQDARVAAQNCALIGQDESASRRVERVIREENRSRDHILRWAAVTAARREGRQIPSKVEEQALRDAYARLLSEAASGAR